MLEVKGLRVWTRFSYREALPTALKCISYNILYKDAAPLVLQMHQLK